MERIKSTKKQFVDNSTTKLEYFSDKTDSELRSSPLCPRFCYAVLGVRCHNWILLRVQVKGNSDETPWKKNTDQKIEMLLFYSLTLSSRTDETVNSVAIYELSAAVYVKKREVQWLSLKLAILKKNVNTVIRGILESTHNFQPKTPHHL